MKLYPRLYVNNIKDITTELLEKNDIKGLILDIDNTLIDYDKNILQGATEWCNNLKTKGIKMCILSNTNKQQKVEKVAKTLQLEYLHFAHKPSKKRFYKSYEFIKFKT